MKRLLALWICIGLMVQAPFFACAEQQADVIRVGLPMAQGAYTVSPAGDVEALLIDSLSEVAKYTNWRYAYVTGTEQELLQMLEDGEIDLLSGVFYNDTLRGAVRYPRNASGYTYAWLVTNPANLQIHKNDYRSLQDTTIAAVPGSKETGRLLSFLAINSIRATILYVSSTTEALDMLMRNEVDMALVGDGEIAGLKTTASFFVEPYYIVARHDREALLDALDQAYDMILDTDPDYVDTLYAHYFEQSNRGILRLTDAERAFIAQSNVIRVAVPTNLPPMQQADDEGMPTGINIDMLRVIEDRTGLSFALRAVDSVPEAVALLMEGQTDAVLGLPGEESPDDEAVLVHTNPILVVPEVVIANKNIDYPGNNLTAVLIPGMESELPPYISNVVYADTFMECVDMVNRGAADCTFASIYSVEYSEYIRTYKNIHILSVPGEGGEMTIALRRPVETALLTTLNKGIQSITDAEMQDIVLKNTTLQEPVRTLSYFINAYPALFSALLTFLFVIIMAVVLVVYMQRTRHNRELYKTQYTDDVTQALNLPGFRQRGGKLLAQPYKYALFYASIRSFQYVNDRYGFEEGDRILRRVAEAFRMEISQENEAFCRVSGATFAALLVYERKEALFARLDAFHDHIHMITPQADPSYHIRMTGGVYLTDAGHRREVLGMIDRANAARQQISASAEVNYNVYKEGIFDNLIHAQALEGRMEAALAGGEFLVYMQPKHNLATLKPASAEALVRWMENGTIISPDSFIPHFERNGFIAHLDRYVFEQCCITLRRWIDSDMPVVPLSINVSRVQLYAQDFIDKYVEIKNRYAIPEGLLELEFTESIVFEDIDRLVQIVQELHQNGFEVSIDDFGKGYSSLTLLKHISADSIKLDAQFFNSGIESHRDRVIIESVVDMAKELGMVSIAEGIETKAQVRLLQMIGCDMAQGYFFSRPLNIASFEAYLAQKLNGDAGSGGRR